MTNSPVLDPDPNSDSDLDLPLTLLKPLPTLTSTPLHHPDSCLSLSLPLLSHLTTLFHTTISGSGPILSIGSGTGLLEALLNAHFADTSTSTESLSGPRIEVEGVEVHTPETSTQVLNAYLAAYLTHTVPGTWALTPRIHAATGVMFVYPRSTTLVAQYLEICARPGSRVEVVVWLGPKRDWVEDYEGEFGIEGWDGEEEVRVMEGVEVGLVGYEVCAILRRKGRDEGGGKGEG